MTKLVDIKKGEQIAEWRRRKFLWIFILSTISVVILDALLMSTSEEKYTVDLILTIFFSVIYLLFLVFYFTVLRKRLVDELNFYSSANKTELSESIIEPIGFEDYLKNNNGLEFYVLKAITKNELEDIEKYYLVPEKFSFKKKSTLEIKTFGTIIVEIGDAK